MHFECLLLPILFIYRLIRRMILNFIRTYEVYGLIYLECNQHYILLYNLKMARMQKHTLF